MTHRDRVSSKEALLYHHGRKRKSREEEDEEDESDGDTDTSDTDSTSSDIDSTDDDDRPKRRRRRRPPSRPPDHTAMYALLGGIILVTLGAIGYVVYQRSQAGSSGSSGGPTGGISQTNTGSTASSSAATSSETAGDTTTSSSSSAKPKPTHFSSNGTTPTNHTTPANGTNTTSSADCFPFGSAAVPSSGAPSVSRSDWWCADDQFYGFMGFAYPLEVDDCSDKSNSYEAINKDLAAMKKDFGASMVRIYAPQCRKVTVWENLVHAGQTNGMGIIVSVWWGFQDNQDAWKDTQSSIYELFTSSTYAEIAPFVVQSAEFGSEPIGDGVDGSNFVTDLGAFRKKMNGWGVPVAISEDWDRGGTMSSKDGKDLGPMGKDIKANTDSVHAHIMPYYHPDAAPLVSDAWPYIEKQAKWLRDVVNQPVILLTECPWASSKGSHGRGAHEDQISTAAFETYWNAFASDCAFFKETRIGWFMFVYSDAQEKGFGMIGDNGESKINKWKPEKC